MAAATSIQRTAVATTAPRNLLVVRLGAMGDVIHTIPAVVAFRQSFPNASIGWIVEERWAELLCSPSIARSGPRSPGRPLVDHLHVTRIANWRGAMLNPRTWGQIAVSLSQLRGIRYDVAVDFQGAIRSALVAALSKAPITYGFAQPREEPASMFYSRKAYVTTGNHIIEQNLTLASLITGPLSTLPEPEFPQAADTDERVAHRLREKGLVEYAILNPGAGWGAKQWAPERYGEVAKQLASHAGLRSLINFGPGEEAIAGVAESASNGAAVALSFTLTELIAATRRATIFIGGDTGPMHLAAALRIPVVGIFGPTNPMRNGPFGTRSAVLRSPASSTSHSRRKRVDQAMLSITAADTVSAALSLLEGTRA
jgi:heptosyltransferase I